MKIVRNTNAINNLNNKTVNFKGLYNNKFLLQNLKFASKNGSLYSTTVSLVLSTAVRPLSILSAPKTDRENKKVACAKSLSSSLVGYLIMFLASTPIARAITKIDKKPQLHLKPSTIKNLQENATKLVDSKAYSLATQIFKLGVGFIIAAPKSALTCVLIPAFMGVLNHFDKKKEKDKSITDSRLGSKHVSFKRNCQKDVNLLSKMIGKIIDTDIVQKFCKKYKDSNFSQHVMSATDVLLTASFVNQTAKSKSIKEERKKPLIYNSIISTALCLTGGYAVNKALNKPTEKFIENFRRVNKNLPDLEKYVDGIRVAKPTLILGGIYYIFIPMIATFWADRIKVNSGKRK